MFGNCATGKLKMLTAPTITVRMAITIATMGRLMKNLDITLHPFPSSLIALAVNGTRGSRGDGPGMPPGSTGYASASAISSGWIPLLLLGWPPKGLRLHRHARAKVLLTRDNDMLAGVGGRSGQSTSSRFAFPL